MTKHSKGDESIPLRHKRTDHDAKKNQIIVDKTTIDDKNSITNTTSRGDSHDNRGVREGIKETSGHVQYDGRGYPENVGDAQAAQEWGNQTSTVQRVVKRAVKTYINQSANSLEILDLLYYLAGKSERDMTPQIYSIAVEGLTEELFADATTTSLSFFREKWILLGRDVDSLYHDIRSAVASADNNSDSAVTEISSQEYQQLVSHFSTTENYDVAGYLLKDGQMLDFSGKHWGYTNSTFRKVDHRDIVEAWGNEDGDGTNEMTRMIANGNVRLMPESRGINLAVMPNKSQLMVLRGYIDHFGGEVIVDVDRIGDDTIHSFSYHKGTSSSRIIADLKAYFENGTIPKPQSDIGSFLYSERTDDSVSNRSLLANAFEGLAQNEIEKNKIQEYKEKIELLDAQERKLHELNRQIKELSFGKGPRDTQKLKGLRSEATKTANRINIYDSQLLRLEASKPLQRVLLRERKKAYDRAVQRGKEKLSDYRENSAKKQVKNKIQRVVNELNDLLLSDDKKRHVPDNLKKAVVAFIEKDDPRRVILVTTDVDSSGKPIMIAVEYSGQTSYKTATNEILIYANPVTTAFGRKDSWLASQIEEAIQDGRMLHADKKRSQESPSGLWSQCPESLWSSDFTANINRFKQNVKRFLPKEKQIRKSWNAVRASEETSKMSERTYDSVSNRSLLANAFEGAVSDELELQKLQEYKEMISLMDDQEKKLQEVNRQIKRLTFDGGAVNESVKKLVEAETTVHTDRAGNAVIEKGTKVRVTDRNNIGTVMDYNADTGNYIVAFRNKYGFPATKNISSDMVSPLYKKQV